MRIEFHGTHPVSSEDETRGNVYGHVAQMAERQHGAGCLVAGSNPAMATKGNMPNLAETEERLLLAFQQTGAAGVPVSGQQMAGLLN